MLKVRKSGFLRTIPVLITIFSLSFPAYAKYSGGTGEPNDPYQIASAEDLILLGESVEDYDKHFIMTDDIDLDPNLPGRKVFGKAVIAAEIDDTHDWFDGIPFGGVFDGKGYIISNLHIDGDSFLGLFGQLGEGVYISDLSLEAVDVNGFGHYTGGLVGCDDYDVRIINCHITGTVSGYYFVGSLMGQNYKGSITNCSSKGMVTGVKFVGGLVGSNRGSIMTSFSNCIVSGNENVGGLAGYNRGLCDIKTSYTSGVVSGDIAVGGLVGINYGNISGCFANSNVSGRRYVGGLVGRNILANLMPNWTPQITNCYSMGFVNGTDSFGGLVGDNDRPKDIISSFWDMQTSGQTSSYGGMGKITAEMQTANTFLEAGWDFVDETANGTEDIWRILEDQTYPRLSWEPMVVPQAHGKIHYVDTDATGNNDGTSWSDAYLCLQDALTGAQDGDEIRVAAGIYKPDRESMEIGTGQKTQIVASGKRTATFQLKNGVSIKGGYAGFGETDPDARDIAVYETILSGDLSGDDSEISNVSKLETEPTRADNSNHVVVASNTNATAVLDGFTITGGNANYPVGTSESEWPYW